MVLGDLLVPLVLRLVFARGVPPLPLELLPVPLVLRLVFALDLRLAAVEGRALL